MVYISKNKRVADEMDEFLPWEHREKWLHCLCSEQKTRIRLLCNNPEKQLLAWVQNSGDNTLKQGEKRRSAEEGKTQTKVTKEANPWTSRPSPKKYERESIWERIQQNDGRPEGKETIWENTKTRGWNVLVRGDDDRERRRRDRVLGNAENANDPREDL